jgi:DNA-binding response OmpR family regulator
MREVDRQRTGGSVLTRAQILDALWVTDFIIESNVVDRHVAALRAKLQNDWRKPRSIDTVPGTGYRFLIAADVQES